MWATILASLVLQNLSHKYSCNTEGKSVSKGGEWSTELNGVKKLDLATGDLGEASVCKGYQSPWQVWGGGVHFTCLMI